MPSHTYDEIYKAVIDYIYENDDLSKLFLGQRGNRKFLNRISYILEECYLKIWIYEDNITEITEEMRYLTAYHISGCLAIVSRWVDSGFAYPKEKIIEFIRKVNED